MEFFTETIDRLLPHNTKKVRRLIALAKELGYQEDTGDYFNIHCDIEYIEGVDNYQGEWSIEFEKGNIFYCFKLDERLDYSQVVIEKLGSDQVIYKKSNPVFPQLVKALHMCS